VSDARAIADVLVPSVQGDNKFWTDSAAALLAACLIRFNNLGDIYQALNDLKKLAAALAKGKDDAALLANSFHRQRWRRWKGGFQRGSDPCHCLDGMGFY